MSYMSAVLGMVAPLPQPQYAPQSADVLHWVRKDDAMILVPYQSVDDEMLWIADARDLTYGEWLDERYAGTAPEPRSGYGPRYFEPQSA